MGKEISLHNIASIKLEKGRADGKIILPAWSGFQSRQGWYGSMDSSTPSNGAVGISINCGSAADSVLPSHIAAITYLVENDELVRDAVLDGLLSTMDELREIYEELLPDITTRQELKDYIGLHSVHVINSVKDDVAYIGFELGCTWDDEHGAGVMMHRNRVIDVGGADVSFMAWVTDDDGGVINEDGDDEEDNSEPTPTVTSGVIFTENRQVNKKPWWKFW